MMRGLIPAIATLWACTSTMSSSSNLGGPIDAFIDGPPGTGAVVVKNYQSQCSVSLNHGTASTAEVLRVDVYNIVVPVSATPPAGFELGSAPWHHTDGD